MHALKACLLHAQPLFGLTWADLQQQHRLVPNGLRSDARHTTSRLHLGNLSHSRLVKLLPLASLDDNPEATPMRVRQVTVMHSNGRAKATLIGVSVHKNVSSFQPICMLVIHSSTVSLGSLAAWPCSGQLKLQHAPTAGVNAAHHAAGR
jgi:hypothetical protein